MNTEEFTTFIESIKTFISVNLANSVHIHGCQIQNIVDLPDDELVIVKQAIASRKYEFSAGRFCARKCLSHYGIHNFQILKGRFGEPLWPDEITGSITHHDNIALSATAQKTKLASIGIDLISTDELLEEHDLIMEQDELNIIKKAHPDIHPELLIFSIKEAAIKICSPQIQDFVDFKDIHLQKDDDGNLYVTYKSGSHKINIIWLKLNNYYFSLAMPAT